MKKRVFSLVRRFLQVPLYLSVLDLQEGEIFGLEVPFLFESWDFLSFGLLWLCFLRWGCLGKVHPCEVFPPSFPFEIMSSIDVQAQQIVVDALASNPKNNQKTILCHTPSRLNAEPGMYLSTQDRLQELFVNEHDSTVAVFPNAQLVRRLCRKFQQDTFSLDLVFACHASSDPNDLVLDLLSKFSVDVKFIQKVSYLADLPEKTFRKNQPFIAHTVKVTHVPQDVFDLHWVCQAAACYEALIPKVIAEIPDIQEFFSLF